MAMFDAVRPHNARYLEPGWKPELEKWYCGHCIDPTSAGTGWHGRGSAMSHCRDHLDDDDPEEGYDYLTGWDLKLALARWRRRNEDSANRFVLQLDSLMTVEDFLTDCGEDVFPDWID